MNISPIFWRRIQSIIFTAGAEVIHGNEGTALEISERDLCDTLRAVSRLQDIYNTVNEFPKSSCMHLVSDLRQL